MKGFIALAVVLTVLPLYASGTIYYADGKNGDDSNDGKSSNTAFATIKACIDALTDPGDQCHIRKGRYHQSEFKISGKQGTASQPIVIRGYEDEVPIIDGTIPLEPKAGWVAGPDGIYSAEIDQDIWQLFVDDEMMTNARWPNALWSDKTIFLNKHWGKSDSSSTRGQMVDNGDQNLAGSGLNAAGAMAILNIGSFNTFTAVVKSHTPGQNFFTYNDSFGADLNFKPWRNQYFLEDKLEFLDTAGEWFYDKGTKTVFVKTLDGESPEGKIRGKVQTYAFTISNCQHLHLKQMTFFGTTFKVPRPRKREVIDSLLFDSINFKFPSYSMRMLGLTDPPQWTVIHPNSHNSFKLTNCIFYGTDGVALEYTGNGVLIKNNLFEYNDWTVANMQRPNGGLGTVVSKAKNDQFIRNTLRYNGALDAYRPSRPNPLVKLNHIQNQCWGILLHDGAGIQFQRGAQTNGVVQKNWVHSSPKFGIRFDAAEPPEIGQNGTVKENVVWKCGGIMVKGDNHKVLNNLAFDKRSEKSGPNTRADGCSLCVLSRFRENATSMNDESVVMRNAADVANGGHIKGVTYALPGRLEEFNLVGDVRKEVVDADNLDFRPRKDSSYNKDNVGPYRYNPSSPCYWIPGRQLYKASSPVPPDGSTTVKSDRDAVMWLNGLGASTHHVYFGTDKEAVAVATEHGAKITGDGNVRYLPESLEPGITYYWRVDAELDDKTTYRGDVWSFQTE